MQLSPGGSISKYTFDQHPRTAKTCGLLILAGLLAMSGTSWGQSTAPTASRRFDLQAGAGLAITKPDYTQEHWKGVTGYTTLDFATHLGIEFVFHQVGSRDGLQLYERSYELGPRYVLHYGRYNPYARGTYGRSVFNYPNNIANLAYNTFGIAGGVDTRVQRHVNVRGEFEFVRWVNFPPHGLTPWNVTFGAAYHF